MHNNHFTVIDRLYGNACYYGVEIKTENGDIFRYDLISPCKEEAKRLAERLSAVNDISPIHFKDIVRDYLTELYLSAIEANGLTATI